MMKPPPVANQRPRIKIKKVRAHGGGHHGGSWKVAYADFVTAMMALFLVLWLVSQGDQKLKENIASYFRSPGVFTSVKGGVMNGSPKASNSPVTVSADSDRELYNTAELLHKKFTEMPQFSNYKDQIKIDFTDEGLRIQIIDKADRVMFEVGKAELKSTTKEILAEIAQNICQLSNKIVIGGHTDGRPYPNSAYTNWELSSDRANAARRELELNCVPSEQIRRVIAYANTEQLVPDPYAPANRRISILLLLNNKIQLSKK